jgi:hypothetical protein
MKKISTQNDVKPRIIKRSIIDFCLNKIILCLDFDLDFLIIENMTLKNPHSKSTINKKVAYSYYEV